MRHTGAHAQLGGCMLIYRWKRPISTRSLVACGAIAAMVLFAWMFRYQDVGSYRGSHIVIDRWTGEVYYLHISEFGQICNRDNYRKDCRIW